MTTIFLVILGVVIAAVCVLFMLYYGGDGFQKSYLEAEAGRLVGEGQQIATALELHYRQEGSFPRGNDPIQQLIQAKYLTHRPLGLKESGSNIVDRWAISYDAGMVRLKIGNTEDQGIKVCLKAREQLLLPVAPTQSGAYRCDGTDSPGGHLGGREPCCIGEVAPGGGSVAKDPYATAKLCGNLTGMPISTEAQKAAYIQAVGACVEERVPLTNARITSLDDIGKPPVDWSAVQSSNPQFWDDAGGGWWMQMVVDTDAQCGIIGYRPNGTFHGGLHEQCYWGYRVPRYYYRNMTTTYRSRQMQVLKNAASKVLDDWMKSSYAGTDLNDLKAAGVKLPTPTEMGGQTSGEWQILDGGNGSINIRVPIPSEGTCTWWRQQKGYSSNKFEWTDRLPEYCSMEYGAWINWYQFNVSEQIRAKQYALLAGMKASGSWGNTASLKGVASPPPADIASVVVINGHTFQRMQISQGLCNYIHDQNAAKQNIPYWNDLDFYYAPITCQSVYRRGWYVLMEM